MSVRSQAGQLARTGGSIVRATVVLDRSQLIVKDGLRTAVGVGLPLLVGLLVGRPLDGATAAAGALGAGFAVFQTGYRTRAVAVLVAAGGIALSTFVGAAVGSSAVLLALTAAVWGLTAGLVVSLGLAASIVGVQSVIGLLVVSQYEMSLLHGAGRAGLVLAGGLLQVLLVMTVWPLRRFPTERRALARVYRSLATYAHELPQGQSAPPDPRPLAAARAALGDPQPFARSDELLAFQGLHDEAERLRMSLSALGHDRARLAGVADRAPAVAALDRLTDAVAGVLDQVSLAIRTPGATARRAALDAAGPEASPRTWARLDDAAAELAEQARTAEPARRHAGASLVRELDRRAQALLGQLRTVVRITGDDADLRPAAATGRRALLPGRDSLATLRANLTLRSAAFRHALRLSAVLGTGAALAELLPFDQRYWLPLTALVVLKPDFTSTYTRGVARVLGTLVGAVLATAVAVLLTPGPVLLAVLVVLVAWAAYTVFLANYALFGASMTGYVVFLLAFAGLPDASTVVDRILATVLGGLLALGAYAVWPTWEGVRVPEQLARLIEAQDRYGAALLAQYAVDGERDLPLLRDRRAAARLARSNAEASVDRMLAEPGGHRRTLPPEVTLGVLAAGRRYALGALALHAHLPQAGPPAARDELLRLSECLSAAATGVATGLRGTRAVVDRPPVREAQRELSTALRTAAATSTAPETDLDAAVLDVETDLLVDSVNSAADLLAGLAPPVRRRRSRRGRRQDRRRP